MATWPLQEIQETVLSREYIYTAFLHCNSSSVDLSLSESPSEALHYIPFSYYHYPLYSLLHILLAFYYPLVVIDTNHLAVAIAINTRSAAPATPASRATKSTQAKKANKAKRPSRSKPNKVGTNRVQKPTPKRKARRYVYIDEDSHTVNNTSRIASPDYISDIPIPPSRYTIPKTPPPSS